MGRGTVRSRRERRNRGKEKLRQSRESRRREGTISRSMEKDGRNPAEAPPEDLVILVQKPKCFQVTKR